MLYTDCIAKLLEMEDVLAKNIEKTDETTEIYLQQCNTNHVCPVCKSTNHRIHNYRTQRIKDIPNMGKVTVLVLRKRRFKCKDCGKQFIETVSFLPRYHRMTNRLAAFVIHKLAGVRSFTDVAQEVGISLSTVMRIFDIITYPSVRDLPNALGIDEFKGNTRGEKYQCILTDVESKVVLDILPTRYERAVFKHLRACDRTNVRYFVSDMWKPYARTAGLSVAKQERAIGMLTALED